MATADRHDPYASFNFLIQIDGITAGAFSEVSGLENETEVIEYRYGNDSGAKRKLPGIAKLPNIVLKRGLTTDTDLWNWRLSALNGAVERKNGSISLLNEARAPVRVFNFTNGWPAKWQGPAFNAGNSEVAIETLEIACESIVLELKGS